MRKTIIVFYDIMENNMNSETFHIPLRPPFLWYDQIRFSAPYSSPLHCHPAWQLTAASAGRSVFGFQNGTYEISPGEWLLISPELTHTSGSPDPESEAIQIFFHHFPADIFPEFAQHFQFRRNFFLKGSIPMEQLKALADSFRQISSGEHPLRNSQLGILPLNFLWALLKTIDFSKIPRQKNHPAIIPVLEFMEEHFSEPLAVQDFANIANLSASRFNDCFHKAMGISPMQYFNEIRLSKAQIFLLSEKTVEETAILSGFSSPGYFCRKFKQYIGLTPGEFLKSRISQNKHP